MFYFSDSRKFKIQKHKKEEKKYSIYFVTLENYIDFRNINFSTFSIFLKGVKYCQKCKRKNGGRNVNAKGQILIIHALSIKTHRTFVCTLQMETNRYILCKLQF